MVWGLKVNAVDRVLVAWPRLVDVDCGLWVAILDDRVSGWWLWVGLRLKEA